MPMAEPIRDRSDLTPAWLTAALAASGALAGGDVVAFVATPVAPARSQVLRLELRYSAGATGDPPRRLVLKLPPPGDPDANRREVDFYRRVAPLAPELPLLRCFYAQSSEEPEWYTLLLGDCADTHRAQAPTMVPPSVVDAEQIVGGLARLHARWWGSPELAQIDALPAESRLRERQAAETARYVAFADALGDRLSGPRRRLLERALEVLPERYGPRLCDPATLTLTHGDPHPGNFLCPHDPARHQLRIIDWKSWGIAAGVSDLAHMIAVFWFPERRARLERPLLEHYLRCLEAGGVPNYAWDELWLDYRLAALRLLSYPVWQWSAGLPDCAWWHHLERLILAVEGLGCPELLT